MLASHMLDFRGAPEVSLFLTNRQVLSQWPGNEVVMGDLFGERT